MIRRLDRIFKKIGFNGARGGAMFFKGLMALTFGLAFHSPWQIIPPPPSGLALLDTFLPLQVWALGWYTAGVCLIIGAFRQNQAWAMGIYSSMLFVWFASYLSTAVYQVFTDGHSVLWYAAAVYGCLLGSAISVARLINSPPPTNLEVVTGELPVIEKGPGDDS